MKYEYPPGCCNIGCHSGIHLRQLKYQILMKFCTEDGSVAVLLSAKLWSDPIANHSDIDKRGFARFEFQMMFQDILCKLEQFHFMAVKYTYLSFYSLVPCYIPCLKMSQPIKKYIAYVVFSPIDCRYANSKETGLSLWIFRSNKNI